MRRHGGRVWALALVALLLAGCTSLDAPGAGAPPPRASPPTGSTSGDFLRAFSAPPRFTLPDMPQPRDIPLAVTADPSWLKPLESTVARADAGGAPGVVLAWYVGKERARIRVTYVDDVPYLTDPDRAHGSASGEHVRQGPVAPVVTLDTGRIEPGAAPVAVAFPVEGRFELGPRADLPEGAGARVNVTVDPAVPAGTPAYVRLHDGVAEPREVDVHPGDAVTFLNDGSVVAGLRIEQVLVRLDASGASAPVAPVDEGGYAIVALARDFSGGRGVAAVRVVADFERPDPSERFGPWSALFACTGLDACDDAREYAVSLRSDARTLVANLSARGPTPGSFDVTLARGGVPFASATVADGGALVARDVPRGDYVLRVRGAASGAGVLAGVTLSAEASYRLPPAPGP